MAEYTNMPVGASRPGGDLNAPTPAAAPADTTEAWLEYYRLSGMKITDELRNYAAAYGAQGKPVPQLADPESYLSGSDRNAFQALKSIFKEYGLEELAPDILRFIREGYDGATTELMLRETESYKKRFAGNEARKKAGLPTLSPAEYVETERAYARTFAAYGLPADFYDNPTTDFADMIGRDLSPQELQSRVVAASDAVYSSPQEVRDEYSRLYGVSSADLIASFLDPEKAAPLVEKRLRTAKVAGAAVAQGRQIDESLASQIADGGYNYGEASRGFSEASQIASEGERLGQIYDDPYSLEDATKESFNLAGAATASKKRKSLASQERASFSGGSGVRKGSLSQDTGAL